MRIIAEHAPNNTFKKDTTKIVITEGTDEYGFVETQAQSAAGAEDVSTRTTRLGGRHD